MNSRRIFSDSDQVRAKIVWEVMMINARLRSHIPGVEVTARGRTITEKPGPGLSRKGPRMKRISRNRDVNKTHLCHRYSRPSSVTSVTDTDAATEDASGNQSTTRSFPLPLSTAPPPPLPRPLKIHSYPPTSPPPMKIDSPLPSSTSPPISSLAIALSQSLHC